MLRLMRKKRKFIKIIFGILAFALSLSLVVMYTNSPSSSISSSTGTGNGSTSGSTSSVNNTSNASTPVADEISALQTKIRQQEEALRVSPKNLSLLLTQGNDHYDLGLKFGVSTKDGSFHFTKAAEDYKQYLALDQNNVDVRVDMATAYFFSSQNKEAEENFQKAIQIDPKHLNAHVNYGVFLNENKDYSGAIKQWETALSLKPDQAKADSIQALIEDARSKS
ncbi:MAG: tetratricopeptide repeat protein [Bacillota bacterium]